MLFGFFYWRRDPNAFQPDRYGPTERRHRQLGRERRWRHFTWVRSLPPLERATMILIDVTAALFIALAGFVAGVVIWQIIWQLIRTA